MITKMGMEINTKSLRRIQKAQKIQTMISCRCFEVTDPKREVQDLDGMMILRRMDSELLLQERR